MATYVASVDEAQLSQKGIKKHAEHCSADPDSSPQSDA
jgi:hypothetical protein